MFVGLGLQLKNLPLLWPNGVRETLDGSLKNDQTPPTSIIGIGKLFLSPTHIRILIHSISSSLKIHLQNLFRTEKNAAYWSKDVITSLLTGLKVDHESTGFVEITEVSSINGEAVVNNRKAKLIFFYEWNITGNWFGKVNGSSDSIEGTFEVTNLSEENEPHEVEVLVSLKDDFSSKPGADQLKELMRTKGADSVRDKLATYIDRLKSEFAKDLIKPTKDSVNNVKNSNSQKPISQEAGKVKINNGLAASSSKATVGVQIPTRDLELKEEFKCRKEELYRALTMSEMVSAFTRSPAVVELEPHGKFSMFGGNVTGTFISIKQDQELKQKWRSKEWPDEHYSELVLRLEEKEDHTLLIVKQTGIPESDFERTLHGWQQIYFKGIKQAFGFGATLY